MNTYTTSFLLKSGEIFTQNIEALNLKDAKAKADCTRFALNREGEKVVRKEVKRQYK